MRTLSRRQVARWIALTGTAAGSAALLSACAAAAPTAAPPKPTAAPSAGAPAAATAAPTGAPAAPTTAPTSAPAPSATAATSPVAAAKPAGGKQPVTIRLHMRTGGEKSEPGIYVDRPGEWQQETGNIVKLEPIPGGIDYVPKMLALAASNTIGDATHTDESAGFAHTQMVQAGIIEPSEDYLTRSGIKKSEWYPFVVDTLTHNGKMYGLPKSSNPAESFITLNAKMFDEAGIKRPDTYGTSFEQVRDWALKLSAGPKDRRDVYGYYTNAFSAQSITNGVRQWGGDLVSPDGTTSLVDSAPFRQWLSWNHDLVITEKVHPLGDVVKAGDSSALAAMFAAGKLAVAHSHRAWQFAFRNAVQGKFEWLNIQLPRGPKALGWVANIDTHSGTAAGKNKDEAFTLIYALADRRMAYLVAKTQAYLTARVDNLDAIKELAQEPFLQLQAKNTSQEERWWKPKNLRFFELEAELTNQLDLVWLGKRRPDDQFIGDLKKGLDGILARPPA